MALNKLDNFIKNTEGRILYVNPSDLDSTDSIDNQGNSLARPFKTIQRAVIEAARFSYVRGNNNDLIEKTTILLFPGEHVVDNRPGWAIYDNAGTAFTVPTTGGVGVPALTNLTLSTDSVFDLTQENNILYKFNSFYGGVIIPRGISIVGLDLRKTKIRPKYVPNPTDPAVNNSAIFRITGTCYFWQLSFFDGNSSETVFTNPTFFDDQYRSTPLFSHHKLTCFEYADGVNDIGNYGLSDLDMYYSKLSNAFTVYRNIEDKFPAQPDGFSKRTPEWEIVGAFGTDPITISDIISGNGSTPTNLITVTTATSHNLNVGTPIKIKGVASSEYNITTQVQEVVSSSVFTYLLPSFPINLNANPSVSNATVVIETDTVGGASPYIFNCSLRSEWGMNGMHCDGAKASGFKSAVTAQFTGVSLQKDDRAFVKYNQESRSYNGVPITTVYGSDLPAGATQTNSSRIYHLDPDAIYRRGWESSHIKISNDAFIQVVSVFAIGFNKHFDANSGSDFSITNSNSNFGQISLSSSGFKNEAFAKDDKAYITSIIPPRAVNTNVEEDIDWLPIDVGLTISVANANRLYLAGFNSEINNKPSPISQGFKIGARANDRLYVNLNSTEYSAQIMMNDATSTASKEYTVSSGPTSNIFTIGSHNLSTGEKVIIISDTGDLPENIQANTVYYAIVVNGTQIKLASSLRNAQIDEEITVYGGQGLTIISRVSDKDAGEIASPIQYDPSNSNWYITVDSANTIYPGLSSEGGVASLGESTNLTFIKRVNDERSLDEKLYKLRVVIPKETVNTKNPEPGFVIQESSTTGVRTDSDFTATSITTSDYDFKRNYRFIANATVASSTVTITSEKAHNLNVNDVVIIRGIKSSTNTTGIYNIGYNGKFVIVSVPNSMTFTYSTTDVDGKVHSPGTFTTDTSIRTSSNVPRFERNNNNEEIFIYRNEIISEYIQGIQDGIYHVYALNSDNAVPTEFTNLKYSQSPVDLYPQLDRDNVEDNPKAARTFAKRSPIGEVVTNDLKKSITRETVDKIFTGFNRGLDVSSVTSGATSATITFSRQHGLSGIVDGTITNGGSGYTNGTYYNVKLYDDGTTTWRGATATVTVSGGAVDDVVITSPGSGHVAANLDFDTTVIGAGAGASYTISAVGISTNIGDVIQFTGDGTVDDTYHRITSVPSPTQVAIAKTSGDVTVNANQYGFVVCPSVRISSSSYNSSTGILTITCSSPHGLLTGNRFRVIDSSNNNRGDYLVEVVNSATVFTAYTNQSLSLTNGYVLKHGLSSNNAVSDSSNENFGVRNTVFYDNEIVILDSTVTNSSSSFNISSPVGISTSNRIPLGSYLQVDNEIVRVTSSSNDTSISVIRGALGTKPEAHVSNSVIRKIKPLAVEFRRPSILRASGHTFEYLGYGPGNYSTSLPQVQVKTLSDRESFLSQSQERNAGIVVYNGINNNGDVFSGNTKTLSSSGEVVSFDIPKPSVTGEDTSVLSAVFDEVTAKQKILVEGGTSGTLLSQFDGPVTFNKEVRIKNNLNVGGQFKVSNSDALFTNNVSVNGNVELSGITTIGTGLLPDTSNGAYIGSSTKPFSEAYIDTLQIGVSAWYT